MRKTAVVFMLLLLPALASGAGFAKQSLFLSKSSVTEGETVLIHAVVNNDATEKFAGSLIFSDNSSRNIGSVPVSLAAGESSVVSVSWKPAAGSHTVVAELKAGAETIEKQSATFVIAEKPKPAVTADSNAAQYAAAVESSAAIQKQIDSLSPQAASATAPVFTLLDGARSAAADVLDTQIANTKTKLGAGAGNPGEVLGASDVQQAGSNPSGAFWYIAQTLYLYLLTILRFIVGSAGVFYPVLAIIFLFVLWKIFRRFRRPAY